MRELVMCYEAVNKGVKIVCFATRERVSMVCVF